MILIVDDKKENLFSLKTLLELNGYATDTADSGEDALRKLLKNDYALVILDVQMPDMDGFEVAENISGYSKTKDIPVIFLSAVNIDKRFISKGYASGGVDYVTKPFDADILLLKVKTFSRLHRQNRELKLISDSLTKEMQIRELAQKEVEQMNATLEKKVEERTAELLEINKALESRNIELQQFASVASHDLQEPLRKIMTFCSLIFQKYLSDNDEAQHYISKVISSTDRMRNLITDLLNFSGLSVEASFTNTSLNEVLNETIADLEVPVAERQAIITTDELPYIDMIPGQLRQVFQNILSNALKFSGHARSPVIKITGEVFTDENIPAFAEGAVRIRISDNGIGFENIYRDKIFLIFQRLHGRSEYDGTGIGLAIVKRIIEKHNGTISADSEPGNGAVFTICLPMKQKVTSL